MNKLIQDALPEIVGGLVVTAVLSIIGIIFTEFGPWISFISSALVVVVILLFWRLKLRNQSPTSEKPQAHASEVFDQTDDVLGRQKTILFIDDEPEYAYPVIDRMKEENFQVLIATTGTQAVKILKSDQPVDLLITDLMMPFGLDTDEVVRGRDSGIRVCEIARALRGNIPIIISTVVISKEMLDKVEEFGTVINKPYMPAELLATIELVFVKASAPSNFELAQKEIERRKIELQSGYSSNRLRAIWTLEQIGHKDPDIPGLLKEIAAEDIDPEVREAAKRAIRKINRQRKLEKKQ